MKNVWLLCCLTLVLTACIHERSVFSSEERVEKSFSQVRPFDIVQITGSVTVNYRQSDTLSVSVNGPKSQVERLNIKAENGRLIIEERSKMGFNSNDVTVNLASPDLLGVHLIGSGEFHCVSPIDTDTMTLRLRGSGEIEMGTIVCDRLDAEVIGSGDIVIKSAGAHEAALHVLGSGDMDVRLRNTLLTTASVKGSGDMKIDFDRCVRADCSVLGSGDFELRGELQLLDEHVNGSGSISKDKLSVRKP